LSDAAKLRHATLSSSHSNYLEVLRNLAGSNNKKIMFARTIVSFPQNSIKINRSD
jgi:hypothetical protein